MDSGHIHIMGTVGAGKSTLSNLLSGREGVTLFPEPVDSNPYLSCFYREPQKYGFPMQVFLMHARYKQALEANSYKKCIMDMSIYGTDIFEQIMYESGDISENDHQTYKDLSTSLQKLLPPPKLVVYLQCSPDVAISRIIKRNRTSELQASIDYWFKLYNAYENWYLSYNLGDKMLINVDGINIVDSEVDKDYVVNLVKKRVGWE